MKHLPIPKLTEKDLTRFWSKVDIQGLDDCWEWASSTRNGYGQININGLIYYAHRISYAIANGDPRELCVCHQHDNPLCVNPTHLWLGTFQDDMEDKIEKERQARGVTQPFANLTEKQVEKILESDETHHILADRYGVSRRSITDIRLGITWKHIKGPRYINSASGNSKTGVRGVVPYGNRYHAEFMSKGVRYRLGYFNTVQEAEQAITRKRKEIQIES